jgi:hypothetical protein
MKDLCTPPTKYVQKALLVYKMKERKDKSKLKLKPRPVTVQQQHMQGRRTPLTPAGAYAKALSRSRSWQTRCRNEHPSTELQDDLVRNAIQNPAAAYLAGPDVADCRW